MYIAHGSGEYKVPSSTINWHNKFVSVGGLAHGHLEMTVCVVFLAPCAGYCRFMGMFADEYGLSHGFFEESIYVIFFVCSIGELGYFTCKSTFTTDVFLLGNPCVLFIVVSLLMVAHVGKCSFHERMNYGNEIQ